jgi:hypothetical protein
MGYLGHLICLFHSHLPPGIEVFAPREYPRMKLRSFVVELYYPMQAGQSQLILTGSGEQVPLCPGQILQWYDMILPGVVGVQGVVCTF